MIRHVALLNNFMDLLLFQIVLLELEILIIWHQLDSAYNNVQKDL